MYEIGALNISRRDLITKFKGCIRSNEKWEDNCERLIMRESYRGVFYDKTQNFPTASERKHEKLK